MRQIITLLFIVLTGSSFAQVTHDIANFNELEVTDKIPVTLILSDKNSLVVSGKLAKELEVMQEDNKLRLKMSSGNSLKGEEVEATLYISKFNKVSVRKGAIVFSGTNTFTLDSLSLVANEGGKIDLAVSAKHIDVYSNSGSSIELKGEANQQNINIFAGGSYNGQTLISQHVTARVNAGGKCIVHATEFADVQTRAGGGIEIYGNPKEKKQKRIAGGSINFL